MMLVNEPQMTKCERCKRRYANVNNDYLGYITCYFCYARTKRELDEHFRKWVDSKIYDRRLPVGNLAVVVRDKCELFIVRDYIRSLILQVNSGPADDEDDYYSPWEINSLLKQCNVGMYHHSLLMSYQNEEWQEIILNYRIRNLGVKYER